MGEVELDEDDVLSSNKSLEGSLHGRAGTYHVAMVDAKANREAVKGAGLTRPVIPSTFTVVCSFVGADAVLDNLAVAAARLPG